MLRIKWNCICMVCQSGRYFEIGMMVIGFFERLIIKYCQTSFDAYRCNVCKKCPVFLQKYHQYCVLTTLNSELYAYSWYLQYVSNMCAVLVSQYVATTRSKVHNVMIRNGLPRLVIACYAQGQTQRSLLSVWHTVTVVYLFIHHVSKKRFTFDLL